ncbi:MFS transporter SCDLUD_002411 [Saccharomycodes ludwigii]|uniref:MFS transporter n=1 Tax=Saccharomycodes ludwigii TaxID=36035 RepID=UPI001E8BB346|nr:hypothetical protein SCDLUD_002411 [Saccharomycodes ludwigii]KAH3900949.1 hypothetical protein SCDLUD_002411 [Saccharomycodes ludwigii]
MPDIICNKSNISPSKNDPKTIPYIDVPTAEEFTNEGLEYVTEHTIETIFSASASNQEIHPKTNTVTSSNDSCAKYLRKDSCSSSIAIEEDREDEEEDEDEDEDERNSPYFRWYTENLKLHSEFKWYQRPTTSMLYFLLALEILTNFITLSPTIILLTEKICDNIHKDSTTEICDESIAQKELSQIQAIGTILTGVIGFLVSGKMGELSDRYGRIFIFRIIAVFGVLQPLLSILFFQPWVKYNRYAAIIATSIGYFAGGIHALIANSNSYISDIVPPKERTIAISILMSIIYGSIGAGPLLGSTLIKISGNNNMMSFYASLLFGAIFLIFVQFFVKESRHHEARRLSQHEYEENIASKGIKTQHNLIFRNSTSANITPFKERIKQLFSIFSPLKRLWIPRTCAGSLIPRYNVLLLMIIDVLFLFSTVAVTPVIVLYSIYTYHWDSVKLGYFISIVGLGRALILLFFAPFLIKFLRDKLKFSILTNSIDTIDKICIVCSSVFLILSITALLVIKSEIGVFLYAFLQVFSAMISPTIQAIILKYSSKKHSGGVFGAIALVRHLDTLIGPPIFLKIYALTIDKNPIFFIYLPFAFSILLFALTLFLKIVYDPALLRRPSQVALLSSGTDNYSTDANINFGGTGRININHGSNNFQTDYGSTASNKKTTSSNGDYPSIMARRPSVLNSSD